MAALHVCVAPMFPTFHSFLRCRSTSFSHGNCSAVIDKQPIQFADRLGIPALPIQLGTRHWHAHQQLHRFVHRFADDAAIGSFLACPIVVAFQKGYTEGIVRLAKALHERHQVQGIQRFAGIATYCLHKAKQAVAYVTKARKNSARYNTDRYLAHFLKMGCKARKPCGWISAMYFQRDQSCDRTPTCTLATEPLL